MQSSEHDDVTLPYWLDCLSRGNQPLLHKDDVVIRRVLNPKGQMCDLGRPRSIVCFLQVCREDESSVLAQKLHKLKPHHSLRAHLLRVFISKKKKPHQKPHQQEEAQSPPHCLLPETKFNTCKLALKINKKKSSITCGSKPSSQCLQCRILVRYRSQSQGHRL